MPFVSHEVRVRARQRILFDSDHYGILYDFVDTGMDAMFKLNGKAKLATSMSITSGEWESEYAPLRSEVMDLILRKKSRTRLLTFFNLLLK